MIRAPPCSRAIAQAVVSSSSRSIAPHAARGDPEPLLGEPRALQLVAAADAADHRVLAHLDAVEAQRRVPVRIGVRERRVVDDRDPRQRRRRRGTASARRRAQRHHDVDGGDVAVGDEPLLAVDPPAAVDRASAVVAMPDGSEPACSSVTA